jgi:hypothetical protein
MNCKHLITALLATSLSTALLAETPNTIVTKTVATSDSEAQALLTKADEFRNFRGKAFSFDLTLVSHEEGLASKSFKLDARILNPHTSLVVYADPPSERGKALLMDGNNLWFSTPTNSKPLRITPQQRLLGEASNGDVASTDFSGDYTPSVVARESLDGADTVKLELMAKAGSLAAYGKVMLWVRSNDAAPVKAEFIGPSGKLLKTAYYRKYETLASLGGKRQLTELEIVNALDPGKRTVMQYAGFKLGEMPESMFTTAYLSKLR